MRIKLVIVGVLSQLLKVLTLLDSHLGNSLLEDSPNEFSVLEDSPNGFSLLEDSPNGFSLLEDHLRPYVDNGGWRTYPGDLVVHPVCCLAGKGFVGFHTSSYEELLGKVFFRCDSTLAMQNSLTNWLTGWLAG